MTVNVMKTYLLSLHFDTCCDADFRNTDLLALGSEGPELGGEGLLLLGSLQKPHTLVKFSL